MRKNRISTPLLTTAATALGIAMGAGFAMATPPAHQPIVLYTYEEIAQQYGMSKMPVQVDPTTKQGFPYSPKQSCGTSGCHDYNSISKHTFHSAFGMQELESTMPLGSNAGRSGGHEYSAANNSSVTGFTDKPKPWTQGTGHVGKW